MTSAADPGLFGPDSVSWRIHGDPSMALGGLRALMLQALHPLAMAGVAQHSGYRTDPWGRLHRTGEYVAAVTYGTTAEAHAAATLVTRVHRHVRGVEPESGRSYDASDPELLRWVHCAEVDSFMAAYRRCGEPLDHGDADRYVREQVRAAALVGVDPADCPASVADLRDYFAGMRPHLRATGEARRALTFVMSRPAPLVARPAWLALTAVAFGLLPAWARSLYGLPGMATAHPGTDVTALVAGRTLRRLVGFLPAGWRESPAQRAALERISA